jgi:hypothetical protein
MLWRKTNPFNPYIHKNSMDTVNWDSGLIVLYAVYSDDQ